MLASSLDYEETLQRVARARGPWLADWCAVDMPDDEGALQQVALAHVDPAKVALGRATAPPLPARAGRGHRRSRRDPQRAPRALADIPDELLDAGDRGPRAAPGDPRVGMRSAMIVPMRAGERDARRDHVRRAPTAARRFDEDDFAFAQELALPRRDRGRERPPVRERRRASPRRCRRACCPSACRTLPGWALAASYQAGERGSDVGGDFYDIVDGDGGSMVLLGDVTGKGVEAAALTALVRHIDAHRRALRPRPGAILALVNEILRRAAAARPGDARLRAARRGADGDADVATAWGGHPPPLLRRAGRTLERLGPSGILLGVVGDASARRATHRLRPGRRGALLHRRRDRHARRRGALRRVAPDAGRRRARTAPPRRCSRRSRRRCRRSRRRGDSDDRALLALRFTGD